MFVKTLHKIFYNIFPETLAKIKPDHCEYYSKSSQTSLFDQI